MLGMEVSFVGRKWAVREEVFEDEGLVLCLHLRPAGSMQDDQPRAFPGPSGARGIEPPAGMRRKEATILLAANFTANNR